MRRISIIIVAFGFPVLVALAALPAYAQGPEGKFRRVAKAITNQYIVVFNDNAVGGAAAAPLARSLARAHGTVPQHIYKYALKGFSVSLPEPAARALSNDPRVAYVEEDGVASAVGLQFNAPWGISRIDQRNLADQYYFYNSSPTGAGTGVNVYVIDTGIRTTHQEFGGRAVAVFDVFGGNGQDCHNHGTHVAGIVGGSTYGVAKRVNLYAVRVLNCFGGGTWSGVIAGVDWVTGNHVSPAVANMSIGCDGGCTVESVDQAVRNSIASGVTYTIAAGNDNIDANLNTPARVSEAITVGSIDNTDTRAYDSNYGSVLDVFAPGVLIPSSIASSDTAVDYFSGTSMAAPHAAGFAAIYLGLFPAASPATVSQALVNSSTFNTVGDPGFGSPNRVLYTFFAAANPIDDSSQFVRQQYLDFLLREPDQSGWDFWTGQITQCANPANRLPGETEAQCVDRKRIDVARAFWYATEFLQQPRAANLPNPNPPPDFNSQEFVRQCYLIYLQREPDQGGLDFWTGVLNQDLANGLGYNHIIRAFLVSLEYRSRFGQPCGGYSDMGPECR
jgi:hypothetical protein